MLEFILYNWQDKTKFIFNNFNSKNEKPSLIKIEHVEHLPKPPQLLSILILFFIKKSHRFSLFNLLSFKTLPYLQIFLLGKIIIFIIYKK